MAFWPAAPGELITIQEHLSAAESDLWIPEKPSWLAAGCWICHQKGIEGSGAAGDHCWAAAALIEDLKLIAVTAIHGTAPAAYIPGMLALREGALLEKAVRALPKAPEVLLVNATGRDHPRRAGLALHLGSLLSMPTVGVTRRPLLAECATPPDEPRAKLPLKIGNEIVGYWLRTKRGAPPVAVHAAWRTDPETAVAIIIALTGRWRTPEPLRQARRAAREARARAANFSD